MGAWVVIIAASAYLLLLFGLAYWVERKKSTTGSLVRQPLIYALSLAVYCTAWTYFGSVGRATEAGIEFLPIYLGPTIFAPVWILLLKKVIRISKGQRLTSIADFISARYGKSTTLGMIATLVGVFGIVPYISIQLKAITDTYHLLVAGSPSSQPPILADVSVYITLALAAFSIFLGTRRLDPNERHEGLVFAIAFESLFKLIAFLAVGIFVTFFLFSSPADLFSQVLAKPEFKQLYQLEAADWNGLDWFFLLLISASAILFLPRQFHVAVVENVHPRQVNQAAWLLPLYLLLINLFVLPIAGAGLLSGDAMQPENYVIGLPLQEGHSTLALLAALGGFSAATSMVLVSVIALSIMIGNNLVLPFLIRSKSILEEPFPSLNRRLLGIRRVSILVIMLLALGYYKSVGFSFSLVSIGLISFCAIAQFLPSIIGGLYWKNGTKSGAIGGLVAGSLIWIYSLALPTLIGETPFGEIWISNGILGLEWTRPQALFGLSALSPVAQCAFWSLLVNTSLYVILSVQSEPSRLELAQADFFVNNHKYGNWQQESEFMRRKARTTDLLMLMERFLDVGRYQMLLQTLQKDGLLPTGKSKMAGEELIQFVEVQLSGSLGAASAKVLMRSIVREDPISMEELLNILDQTQEVVRYSKALEDKSRQLERTTLKLKVANEQLKDLDQMKADFISTVTHELRTPITAIKGIAGILRTYDDLEPQRREEFLDIVQSESERLTRLINQVLDLEKIQAEEGPKFSPIEFRALLQTTADSLKPILEEKGILCSIDAPSTIWVKGNTDRLTQVILNLLSNAIKFCPSDGGRIKIRMLRKGDNLELFIQDNGIGIPKSEGERIFQRFTQVTTASTGKPPGSGLGLFICKKIIENHQGNIQVVEGNPGQGACFQVELPCLPEH